MIYTTTSNLKLKIFGLMFFTGICSLLRSQTPSDAIMMKPGQICAGVSYNNNTWSKYWEGDSLRSNGNFGTVTTQAYSAGFVLGIINKINLLVSVPYVISNPDAGTMKGSKGLQDIAIYIKYDALEKEMPSGKLSLLATAGFSTPVSNYFPEEPFAIGLGCPDGSIRGIAQYKLNMGIYGKIQAAYHLRGYTNIDQTYYYTTQAYYTNEIDMPDAFDYAATLGYFTKDQQFKGEVELSSFNTINGFDIRRQDGGFPSNDMDATKIGVNLDYYTLDFIKGFGIHAGAAYVINGRNVGQSLFIGGGLSYIFNIWNKNTSEAQDKK